MRWFNFPPIEGGSVDTVSELPQVGEGGEAAATATEEAAVQADTYEIDGETYAVDDLRAALDSHRNRETWERAYKQRDMTMAGARKGIERAFGKPVADLDENDLEDLRAFGELNTRLRTDSEFKRAYKQRVAELWEERGLSPAAARQVAEEQTEEAAAAVPSEVTKRIERLEEMIQERTLTDLANTIEGTVSSVLQKVATDMPKWHRRLRKDILGSLLDREDEELMELAERGELAKTIQQLAAAEIRQLKADLGEELKGQGKAVAAGKAGSGTAPFRGGAAAPAATEPAPEPGQGLAAFHKRMRERVAQS